MGLLVDRPRARILTIQGGKGDGKQVMANPTWGDDKDPVPVAVRVFVNTDSGEKWIDSIDGPFESIAQAEELALQAASAWYDRGNG